MPRKKKEVIVVTVTPIEPAPAPETSAAATNGQTESVAGYFRRVFEENPRLLNERSNDKLYERWLADHPGHAEVPEKVKANLQNLKSVLRKQAGKNPRRRAAAPAAEPVAAAPAPVQRSKPKASSRSLEQLEAMIDQCLFTARGLGAEGLERTAALLREARNEVIRQAGGEE